MAVLALGIMIPLHGRKSHYIPSLLSGQSGTKEAARSSQPMRRSYSMVRWIYLMVSHVNGNSPLIKRMLSTGVLKTKKCMPSCIGLYYLILSLSSDHACAVKWNNTWAWKLPSRCLKDIRKQFCCSLISVLIHFTVHSHHYFLFIRCWYIISFYKKKKKNSILFSSSSLKKKKSLFLPLTQQRKLEYD